MEKALDPHEFSCDVSQVFVFNLNVGASDSVLFMKASRNEIPTKEDVETTNKVSIIMIVGPTNIIEGK